MTDKAMKADEARLTDAELDQHATRLYPLLLASAQRPHQSEHKTMLQESASVINRQANIIHALKAEAVVLERDRDHWKANHDHIKARIRLLLDRPDLPQARKDSLAYFDGVIDALKLKAVVLRDALLDMAQAHSDSIKERSGPPTATSMALAAIQEVFVEDLRRLAASLPAAAEQGRVKELEARELVAQWMLRHSYATGHGDTVADLLGELTWQHKERATKAEANRRTPGTNEVCALCGAEDLSDRQDCPGDWHGPTQDHTPCPIIRAAGVK